MKSFCWGVQGGRFFQKGDGIPNLFTVSQMALFRGFISKVCRKNKVSQGISEKSPPWPPEVKKNKRVDKFKFVYYNSCMLQPNEKKFSHLVGELFRKLNLLNRDQKVCYGITLSQCCAIETLEQRGLLSMNELSQYQGVTLSTMTRVVDVLVRDGVVRRESSPGDRRKVCIELTEEGKNLAQKLKKCTEAYTKEILDQIPVNKHGQVVESVELLIKAIESVNPKCCV
jgi:DNA-binding MarR family transcriptional regulator